MHSVFCLCGGFSSAMPAFVGVLHGFPVGFSQLEVQCSGSLPQDEGSHSPTLPLTSVISAKMCFKYRRHKFVSMPLPLPLPLSVSVRFVWPASACVQKPRQQKRLAAPPTADAGTKLRLVYDIDCIRKITQTDESKAELNYQIRERFVFFVCPGSPRSPSR